MGSLKRQMKRNQRKTNPGFYVSAWAENGNITVIICAGCRISGTGVLNTGLPDSSLPWLAEKIVARIEQSPCRDQEDALCIADQVIQEQKPVLVSLADSRGNGKGKGRFIEIPDNIDIVMTGRN
ncbi:hypothetical protein ES703_58050 [subsurface metagenome]